jgi:MOSC domain-containing protein YiiM
MQKSPKKGIVVYITVRPKRLEPVRVLNEVPAISGKGLVGDRYQNKGGTRQVTLIQAEHLKTVSSFLGSEVKPEAVRRNIVVEGINLFALKGKKFKIGEAILEYSGECHPCSRMETNLGNGGFNAMRGHGGITARVISDGVIKIGSKVEIIEQI